MKIKIDNSILDTLPNFNIIAYSMDVTCEDSSKLESLISKYEEQIMEEYSIEDILNIPLIKEARDGYKALGKDPSRYRLACESLLRRLVKGNKLYRINNLVDAGNILSIITKRSVAVLDYDKIVGDILIRKGQAYDDYEGIGRGKLNIENIPLYEDEVGPFGSTTSDTPRTMVTEDTKKILLFVVCFSKNNILENEYEALSIFEKYCDARNIVKINTI